MRMRGALFIAALGAAVRLGAADAAVEFSGMLTNEGRTKLALTDKATGVTRWVEPGELFLGYTVARYDAEEEAVFLRKAGEETRLPLVAAKSPRDAATTAAAAGPADAAVANAVRANLRLLAGTARRYQLERGATTVTYADLVGPDKLIRELRPVAGENYGSLVFSPGATSLTVTLANGTPVSAELPPLPAQAGNPALAGATPAAPVTAPAAAAGASPAPPPPAAPPAVPVPGSEPLQPTGRPPEGGTYTTPTGETWEEIAEKTGVPVPKLKELNSPLPSGSSLPAGQTIRLR